MANDKAPCLNCPERYPACHGKCEKYQKWKAKYDSVNSAKTRANAERDTLIEVHRNGLKRRNKK